MLHSKTLLLIFLLPNNYKKSNYEIALDEAELKDLSDSADLLKRTMKDLKKNAVQSAGK